MKVVDDDQARTGDLDEAAIYGRALSAAEIEGLFVAGEDAGGVHGANRLGGNGVADSTVFGGIAGDVMADWVVGRALPQLSFSMTLVNRPAPSAIDNATKRNRLGVSPQTGRPRNRPNRKAPTMMTMKYSMAKWI